MTNNKLFNLGVISSGDLRRLENAQMNEMYYTGDIYNEFGSVDNFEYAVVDSIELYSEDISDFTL